MHRTIFLKLLIVSSTIFLSGYTGCQYYAQVQVPASDTDTPILTASILIDGEHKIRVGELHESYTTPQTFYAISSIMDAGGAKWITMYSGATVHCRNNAGIAQRTDVHYGSVSDQQAGGPGSTVSNGIWVYRYVDLGSFHSLCSSGFTLTGVDYGWFFEGEDYFGHRATGSGAVSYDP